METLRPNLWDRLSLKQQIGINLIGISIFVPMVIHNQNNLLTQVAMYDLKDTVAEVSQIISERNVCQPFVYLSNLRQARINSLTLCYDSQKCSK